MFIFSTIFQFLGGKAVKFFAIGAVLVGLGFAAMSWLHTHDNQIRAQIQVSSLKAENKAIQANNARVLDALQQNAKMTEKALVTFSHLKDSINALPKTTACVRSPSIRAFIGGLRQLPGPNSSGPSN